MRRKGLTLIELLVAIAILAILAGLFFAPIISSMKIVNKGQMRIDAQDAARLSLEQISREISHAVLVYDNSNPALGRWSYVDFRLPQTREVTDPDTGQRREILVQPLRPADYVVRYYTLLRLQHDNPTNPNAGQHDPEVNPLVLYRAQIPESDYPQFSSRHPTANDPNVVTSALTPTRNGDVVAFRVVPALVRDEVLKPLNGSPHAVRFGARFPLWLWEDRDGNGVFDGIQVVGAPSPPPFQVNLDQGVVDFGLEGSGYVQVSGDGNFSGTNLSAQVTGRWIVLTPDPDDPGGAGERLLPDTEVLMVREGGGVWKTYKRVSQWMGLPAGRWYGVREDPSAPMGVRLVINAIDDPVNWEFRITYRYTYLPQNACVMATYRTRALLDVLLGVVRYDEKGKPQGVRLSTRVRVKNAVPTTGRT